VTITTRKVLSAAVALSAALALTAVPASAAPTTLASALAALTAAEAQVTTAIHDQATLSVTAWDAQMKAALAAEHAAEAELAPFIVPPPTTDFGVVHSFDYRYGNGLVYQVQLAPLNGSTTAGPSGISFGSGGSPGCDKNGLAGDGPTNFSGVCYGRVVVNNGTMHNQYVQGVVINLNTDGNGNTTGVRTETIFVNFFTQTTVVGSNGQTYHPLECECYPGPNSPTEADGGWNHSGGAIFELPTGVKVVQVKWSNVDPNGETTTAVWNV
jgi:hypothetical protein